MKTTLSIHRFPVLSAALITLFLLNVCGVFAENSGAVNFNGGFEEGGGVVPVSWHVFGPDKGEPVLSREKPHGGSLFLRVPVGAFSSGQISGVDQNLSPAAFKAGDVVTVAANIRIKNPLEEGVLVKVAFEILESDKKARAVAVLRPNNKAGEWQALTSSLTVPTDFTPADKIKVIASVFCKTAPKQENEIDFDDIVVSVAPAAK